MSPSRSGKRCKRKQCDREPNPKPPTLGKLLELSPEEEKFIAFREKYDGRLFSKESEDWRRLYNEAAILKLICEYLEHHPEAADCFNAPHVLYNGALHLPKMEYGDLFYVMIHRRYASLPDRLRFCSSIEPVMWLHRMGLVHQDVKPENFCIGKKVENDKNGEPCVALIDHEFDCAPGVRGTHRSPHQWAPPHDDLTTHILDLYALARMCYMILTGQNDPVRFDCQNRALSPRDVDGGERHPDWIEVARVVIEGLAAGTMSAERAFSALGEIPGIRDPFSP